MLILVFYGFSLVTHFSANTTFVDIFKIFLNFMLGLNSGQTNALCYAGP